jgi:hypothetical protein
MSIASPVLTVQDNANGSGNTVALTIDPTATSTIVYRSSLSGGVPQQAVVGTGAMGINLPWHQVASLVSSGSVSVATPNGFYLWWAVSQTSGGVCSFSMPVYAVATSGLDCLHDRIFDATQARIKLLALPGIAQVYVKEYEDLSAVQFPCVVLSIFGKSESEIGGTNQRDDRGYPVMVTLLDREPETPADRQAIDKRRHKNRQGLLRSFREQLLPGVPEVMTCRIEPDAVTVSGKLGLLAVTGSAFLMRFVCREARGFGA